MLSKKLIIRLSLVLVAGCTLDFELNDIEGRDSVADSVTDTGSEAEDSELADRDSADTDAFDSDTVDSDAFDSDAFDSDAFDSDTVDSDAFDSDAFDSDAFDSDAFDSDAFNTETELSDTDSVSEEESYFSTCQQLLDANPRTADGKTTLYVNSDPDKPWTAYCAGMPNNPAEYLVLAATGNNVNFSQYTAGTWSPGTNVRTVYQRLRLDPVTLQVDTGNQTFSSSSGSLTHGSDTVTSMPYATAMACDTSTGKGRAVVDLAGTPFHIADTFKAAGSGASGAARFSNGNKRADIWVLGDCGWLGQTDSQYNPYNNRGCPLQLAYDRD